MSVQFADQAMAGLTRSERMAITARRTWSGAQRNRLIEKGLVDPSCRGAPCLPKKFYETPSWALPLTPLGLAVRRILSENNDG